MYEPSVSLGQRRASLAQALIFVCACNFAEDQEFGEEIDDRLHQLSAVLDGIGGLYALLVL